MYTTAVLETAQHEDSSSTRETRNRFLRHDSKLFCIHATVT